MGAITEQRRDRASSGSIKRVGSAGHEGEHRQDPVLADEVGEHRGHAGDRHTDHASTRSLTRT
jgi:hypothetical protein